MKPKSKKIVNSILSFVLVVCVLMSNGLATVGSVIANHIVASAAGVTIVKSGNCGERGNDVKYTLDNEGTLIIFGEGKMESYIGFSSPFCKNASIRKINIEKGVKSIGGRAFVNCSSLTKVVISDSVTEIGFSAFENCTNLEDIRIPESVTFMDQQIFYNCTNLKYILLPQNMTTIEASLLNGCKSLNSIIIPNNVTSIGTYAFSRCNINTIIIPKNVKAIMVGAFQYCDNLKNIYYSGSKEEWKNINISIYNECLTNANIHFNYHQPSVVIDADAYRFYYSQDTITLGDKFIVGADKLGGNCTGIYYPGPGQVEWEISNRNVIDFIPIHDSKTGKDILYYNDTTQLHLEAKNFGESKLTMKLNGVPVCSEMIEVRYNDDAVIKNYKDQILDTSVMSTLNQGKTASFDVVKKFSKLDQLKISFMTNLDNYMGFGTLAKWIGSSIGLTTSQYEDCVDETVEALIADYLSIEKSVFDDISDLESKYNFIKTAINVGDSKGFGIKNDIIIQNLAQQTSFSAKQISKVFKLAEKFADGALSVAEIGATAVMLAQFDLDVLGKLSSAVQESASGDCGSDMYKSINRIMDRVYNLEDYVNELMATDVLMDQFISLAIDLCLDSKNLTTVGLILEIGDFLAAKYKASGGIMADDYVNTCVSFNNAWVMYHAIEKSTNMADFKFDYEFYVSAVKVALKYAEKLSDGKSDKPYLKDNVINCYELIEKGCSFESLMK